VIIRARPGERFFLFFLYFLYLLYLLSFLYFFSSLCFITPPHLDSV